MKFFCITDYRDGWKKELLAKACVDRDIEFVEINPDTFDYTQGNPIAPGDLFYRMSILSEAGILERSLLRDDVVTFYMGSPVVKPDLSNSFIIHAKEGIPIPKTIPHLSRDRDLLRKYSEYVGGFPLIIKVVGGSRGMGVMKVDSLASLFSVVDYVLPTAKFVIMREFIKSNTSARFVVLGDKVIDSYEYVIPPGDFRSNAASTPSVEIKKYSKEIEETAVKAVQARRLEFGGVDMIMDEQGRHYVMEVNFPFNLARAQNLTGTDVAGKMIDYLIRKRTAVV